MSATTVGDILEATIRCHSRDQDGLNIRHYSVTAATGGGVTFAEVASNLFNRLAAAYVAIMNGTASFHSVSVRRVAPIPPSAPEVTILAPVINIGGGPPAPRQVTGVIGLFTGVAGRKGRGRVYVPFPSNVHVDDGSPTNAYVAGLQGIAAQLLGVVTVTGGVAGTSAELIPVLYHRLTRTANAITNATGRARFGTQRRRGDYGRANPL